jgi:hypothetical protein
MQNSPDPLDDLFAEEPPKKQTKPQSQTPAPVPEEDDVFASVMNPVPFDPPYTKTPSAAVPAVPAAKYAVVTPLIDDGALEGFNSKEFDEVRSVVSGILAKVDKADLDSITKTLPEYAVRLDLDHNRENPAIISDRIAQVQARLDSIHAVMMKLGPEAQALTQAWDYIADVGIVFSNASNREKRAAQAKLVMKDLWQRFVLVKALHISVEKSYKHLQIQFDTLSRLITCGQERTKEVSRGALPYESNELAASIAREVNAQMSAHLAKMMAPVTTAARAYEAAPGKACANAEMDFLNDELAQPLSTKNLDDFPKNVKVPTKNDKKGFVDF